MVCVMDGASSNPSRARSASIPLRTLGPRPPSNTNSKARRFSSLRSTKEPYTLGKTPTVGQWIKLTWLDILTMLIVGALVFPTYYYALPLGTRVFPLDTHNYHDDPASAINPNLLYPLRPQTVNNWVIALVAISVPIIVILLMQFRLRSFWDLNNGLLGFAYALLASAAFQGTTKAFVGGLRPNFYDVCQANPAHAMGQGNKTGWNGIGSRGDMWSKDVCTTADGSKLRNAMQAFPSGHSTTMVASMLYLSLYLNAKLKVFADYHTPLWKLIVILIPLLGAVLLCGTLIIDNTHSWYDIAAGATIGALVALAAFRMVYAGVFDWRVNHIPLCRNVPFNGRPRPDLVATGRAGWRETVEGDGGNAMRTPSAGGHGHEVEDGDQGRDAL
ncbi:PAP2 superfamily-domain-containing protein [Nemania sp. FL0916]|nr:PAP2 superfamily-domain-containing protein [Nemania sp. FL0916]